MVSGKDCAFNDCVNEMNDYDKCQYARENITKAHFPILLRSVSFGGQESPHAILAPEIRWFPADEVLRDSIYALTKSIL